MDVTCLQIKWWGELMLTNISFVRQGGKGIDSSLEIRNWGVWVRNVITYLQAWRDEERKGAGMSVSEGDCGEGLLVSLRLLSWREEIEQIKVVWDSVRGSN
ncbi:coiled-coil domain-containing protein 115 [Platysternon megacephalum]|uniref:Coiled-coil domain-containing protein 115 n=1 Tax=Platysternon megacephalum TaxID=55544 RepID=A0A4D9DVP8_9SAUR|nr:coiled-coil domain-containing protein 115 [Platysternon megacephalum]